MSHLAKRLLRLLLVVLATTAATFFMANVLPGDPAVAMVGFEAEPEVVDAVRRELGLDQPLLQRFVDWIGDAVRGDLGESYLSNVPVVDLIRQRAPTSFELMVVTQVVALLIAVPLALAAAYRPRGVLAAVADKVSFVFLCTPPFVLAMVLILLLAVRAGVVPASGWVPFTRDPVEHVQSMILPTSVLVASLVPLYFPVLRAELLQVLREDYILTARSAGLPPSRILRRHAFRPAALPLMTLVGVHVGHLIGGAVLVEHIFGIPGLGSLLVDAIAQRDFPVIQAAVLVGAVGYVIANFAVDTLYPIVDPRIRHGRG